MANYPIYPTNTLYNINNLEWNDLYNKSNTIASGGIAKEQQINNWKRELEKMQREQENMIKRIQLQSDYISYLTYHKEFFKEEEPIPFLSSAIWLEHLTRMRDLLNESK